MVNEDSNLIPGCPDCCARCSSGLCARKQVVNLSLGYVDEMLCLSCIAAESDTSVSALLDRIVPYIMTRECFSKQWRQFSDPTVCAHPQGCHDRAEDRGLSASDSINSSCRKETL